MSSVDLKKPYSLRAIWDQVSGALAQKLREQADIVLKVGFGEKERNRTESPPRIVCVPIGGTADSPVNRSGDGIETPWAVWGRNVRCEFDVWGNDQLSAELLANHFVASLHDARGGLYKMLDEEWDTSRDTKLGEVVKLTASIYTLWSRELIPSIPTATPAITGSVTHPTS